MRLKIEEERSKEHQIKDPVLGMGYNFIPDNYFSQCLKILYKLPEEMNITQLQTLQASIMTCLQDISTGATVPQMVWE